MNKVKLIKESCIFKHRWIQNNKKYPLESPAHYYITVKIYILDWPLLALKSSLLGNFSAKIRCFMYNLYCPRFGYCWLFLLLFNLLLYFHHYFIVFDRESLHNHHHLHPIFCSLLSIHISETYSCNFQYI